MDIQPERLKDLLKNLVNIYSPPGKEEKGMEYAEGYLKNQGLTVTRQEVDDGRFNIIVLPEEDKEVDLNDCISLFF